MPHRDPSGPLEAVVGCTERLVERLVEGRHHARQRLVEAHPEGLGGLPRELRVGAATLHQPVEDALLALQVAALQPGALAAVGLDEHGVLHVEGVPDPLPGHEQHVLVDAQVVPGALVQQRLPQHPGAEAVGVEHQLHRHTLPGPSPAGLAPHVGGLLARLRLPGHGQDAAADVLARARADVGAQVVAGLVVPLAVLLEQRQRDVVGDRVGAVDQRGPRPLDLPLELLRRHVHAGQVRTHCTVAPARKATLRRFARGVLGAVPISLSVHGVQSGGGHTSCETP